jgi:hypothetical protein
VCPGNILQKFGRRKRSIVEPKYDEVITKRQGKPIGRIVDEEKA